jgi:Ca2+-binding EF-hand superfamily protein
MANEQEQLVAAIAKHLDAQYGDRSKASMRKLFDRYDANHDGKLDKSELTQLLKDIDIGNALTRGVWVKGIIDRIDTNADRMISWDEFEVILVTPPA